MTLHPVLPPLPLCRERYRKSSLHPTSIPPTSFHLLRCQFHFLFLDSEKYSIILCKFPFFLAYSRGFLLPATEGSLIKLTCKTNLMKLLHIFFLAFPFLLLSDSHEDLNSGISVLFFPLGYSSYWSCCMLKVCSVRLRLESTKEENSSISIKTDLVCWLSSYVMIVSTRIHRLRIWHIRRMCHPVTISCFNAVADNNPVFLRLSKHHGVCCVIRGSWQTTSPQPIFTRKTSLTLGSAPT